jgi:hypothetical protein
MTMLGFQTITQGQRAAVWDRTGRRTIVDGPRRQTLWGRRIELLEASVAGPTQYLILQYRDGRIEHQRGPAVRWTDPVEHLKITVADAIALDANESLVVYRQQTGQVQRRIVRGPELFIPNAQEWMHQFRWHGADPRDPRRKIPRALVFNKLRVIPDQTYFDVQDVRTSDDALLTVKLMIFYELMDISLMLDQTHDPIADFINALTADVMDFASGLTFEKFKEQTERLNARETYAQLAQRAGCIGYRINKIVYRGYQATDKLQEMHDRAIETRTRLKLDSETEVQAQELADLKLARERDRSEQRRLLERCEIEHQGQVKRIAHEEQLREQQLDHDAKLRQQQQNQEQSAESEREHLEMQLKHRQATYEQRGGFLKTLQGMQVDMTRFLVARNERPDRRIRLDGDPRTQLHLHDAG